MLPYMEYIRILWVLAFIWHSVLGHSTASGPGPFPSSRCDPGPGTALSIRTWQKNRHGEEEGEEGGEEAGEEKEEEEEDEGELQPHL